MIKKFQNICLNWSQWGRGSRGGVTEVCQFLHGGAIIPSKEAPGVDTPGGDSLMYVVVVVCLSFCLSAVGCFGKREGGG